MEQNQINNYNNRRIKCGYVARNSGDKDTLQDTEFVYFNLYEEINRACDWLKLHIPYGETTQQEILDCINDFKEEMLNGYLDNK